MKDRAANRMYQHEGNICYVEMAFHPNLGFLKPVL